MSTREEIAASLVDVREAYRIVWAYQRRVLDIAGVFGSAFAAHRPYWRASPRAGATPLGHTVLSPNPSAWAFLPMAEMCFTFTPDNGDHRHPKRGDVMLELHAVADTGFETPAGGQEPDPVHFRPASRAETRIDLVSWRCDRDYDGDWWSAWELAPDYSDLDEHEWKSAAPPLSGLKLSYDLVDLPDRRSVDEAVAKFKALVEWKLGGQ